MASNGSIIGWILFVTSFAVMELTAVARELFPAPMASQDAATTITSQISDVILEWLKITAVPLGVFLVGACTWGCIKNSGAWRSFSERRGNPSDTSGGDEVRRPERLNNPSGGDGSDHPEEGMALSNRRTDIDDTTISATSTETVIPMQAVALQSHNGDGNCCPTTGVAPDH